MDGIAAQAVPPLELRDRGAVLLGDLAERVAPAHFQLGDAEKRIDEARRAAMDTIGDIAGDVAHSAMAKLIGIEPDEKAVAAALKAAAKGDA